MIVVYCIYGNKSLSEIRRLVELSMKRCLIKHIFQYMYIIYIYIVYKTRRARARDDESARQEKRQINATGDAPMDKIARAIAPTIRPLVSGVI